MVEDTGPLQVEVGYDARSEPGESKWAARFGPDGGRTSPIRLQSTAIAMSVFPSGGTSTTMFDVVGSEYFWGTT